MLKYYHAWNCVFNGLPRPFWTIIKHFPDVRYAWEKASLSELANKGLRGPYKHAFLQLKKSGKPFADFENFRQHHITPIGLRDTQYPSLLRNMNKHLPPPILYVQGTLPEHHHNVSIVGTRDMSTYGEQVTTHFIKEFSRYDICIVSGLARGIDITAHTQALANNLPTIAILGFGHFHIPYYRKKLTQSIIENGCLVSEYPPHLKAQKYHFPLRNRIIAGLSAVTVIIEAGKKSGARITAQYALDQGREVMAVPGTIYQEKSAGTNALIEHASAQLVSEPSSIIKTLDIPVKKQEAIAFQSKMDKAILTLLEKEPLSHEQIMQQLPINAKTLNTKITELEIEQLIKKNSTGRYYATYSRPSL
ncbi:DNA-protecting protein DprA [Candidatus Peregrinibacteria bacterium]|nr:DNA-protecting protein DprA [Candidatus Peregrinibacteria bacterium]